MGRPKTDKHPARLTVTLDEEDYKEVCARAERNDVSAAWVIRRAVQDYLGRSSSSVMSSKKPAGRLESRK
ncbi:ribbon-helix-helix domain-containing protein [Mesorhizobium opportunistum]|uniref:ribbon-helix-helix domain-containing protein n=1 Tax=Mesorhizobium opportunistum TaxID=593909 RepID=UPI00333CC555